MTPVLRAPTKPRGLPMAITSSPGRICDESATDTAGRPLAAMHRAARSRRESRQDRCLEFAVIPKLNAGTRAANHMRVSYDGTVAAIFGVDQNSCPSQFLCNFA